MEHIGIQTTQNVTINYELAGVGDRIVATLIDLLIIITYFIAVTTILSELNLSGWGVWTLASLPAFFYDLIMEISMEGQTVGKRAMKIRVANLDGSSPTTTAYLLRWLLRPVEVMIGLGVVAITAILLGNNGQRLGDMAAGTTVLLLKKPLTLEDTIFENTEEDYKPRFPQVANLKQHEVEVIRDVLKARTLAPNRKTFESIAHQARLILEERLQIPADSSDAPSLDVTFLETLLKDYNAVNSKS